MKIANERELSSNTCDLSVILQEGIH